MSEPASNVTPPGRPGPGPGPADTGGLDASDALTLLRDGEITVTGRLLEASNATLYCEISLDGVDRRCVYKPVRGERALWDFPDGTLAGRERAAYLVSEETGTGIVPPTVLRGGPFGTGMVQLWIDVDETVDLLALIRSDDPRLRAVALFDAVINNADRKGGHLLPAPSGRVYGVDHGVTFHVENKLRTVLWTWRGQRLRADETELLTCLREALDGPLAAALAGLLTTAEIGGLRARAARLLTERRFPMPSGDWPAIPWPPF
ncbi:MULTISPECIES: SCO1664 family protein [unclassified Frankia]|uniref:SCO1664 family protein n=1 Tax=unclassified Frankia TaxID=2632575 RepID=UPI002024C874